MIQAPQMQYIPVQQPVQQYQQPTYTPVQYNTNPGVFYNYPNTSCYAQPYCTDKSQYNGVNIEIINPQGQGIPAQGCYQMPAQFVPVQQPVMIPQQPQFATPFPVSQAINQAPVMPQAVQQPAQPMPQVAQPLPQPVIMTPAPQIVNPAQPVQVAPEQPQAAAQQVEPQVIPEIADAEALADSVSPESFAGRLRSNDLDAQKATIEEIAEYVHPVDDNSIPEQAKQINEAKGRKLLDSQIFDALVDIIDKDTSGMQGPSPEVVELRQKPEEELTQEQKALIRVPSELERAEVNKQYSLYTIAYMQDMLNKELEKRGQSALELKDLPCIEKVVDTVKSNQNPEIRLSAIKALSYIARPEYKADLTTIFELAKADESEEVRNTATEALTKLN